MNTRDRWRLATMLVLGVLTAGTAAEVDLEQAARRLLETGADTFIGQSDDTGAFLLVLSPVPAATEGQTLQESLALSMIRGKRKLAGMLGESVTASEESASSVVTVMENGEEKTTTADEVKSLIRIDVDQVLKGVRMLRTITGDDGDYLVLFASQKTLNAFQELQQARQDESPNTVKAVGLAAVIDANIPQARDNAIRSAQSAAIEQVLGALVTATDQASNDRAFAKVFASSGGCIKQYRVIEEGPLGTSNYRVALVAEVARDELLKSYDAILASMGDIKFYVESGHPWVRNLLTEKFVDWGCPVTENRAKAAYVIACHGAFEAVTHPADGRTGTRVSLSIRILDAQTGAELLTAVNDPRKATSFVGAENRRKHLAAEMAMKEMHGKLHAKLQRMIGKMAASGRDVQIRLDNFTTARQAALDEIAACIRETPGCGEPKVKADLGTREAVITVNYQASMEALRDFVTAAMKKRLPGAHAIPGEVGLDANAWKLSW